MEQEMTVEELIALINASKGDFMIQVELKEDLQGNVRSPCLQRRWSIMQIIVTEV